MNERLIDLHTKLRDEAIARVAEGLSHLDQPLDGMAGGGPCDTLWDIYVAGTASLTQLQSIRDAAQAAVDQQETINWGLLNDWQTCMSEQ